MTHNEELHLYIHMYIYIYIYMYLSISLRSPKPFCRKPKAAIAGHEIHRQPEAPGMLTSSCQDDLLLPDGLRDPKPLKKSNVGAPEQFECSSISFFLRGGGVAASLR